MAGRLVEAALALISSSTSRKRPLPVDQGGHSEAGGQRQVIAHKDSLSGWLCPGGRSI